MELLARVAAGFKPPLLDTSEQRPQQLKAGCLLPLQQEIVIGSKSERGHQSSPLGWLRVAAEQNAHPVAVGERLRNSDQCIQREERAGDVQLRPPGNDVPQG